MGQVNERDYVTAKRWEWLTEKIWCICFGGWIGVTFSTWHTKCQFSLGFMMLVGKYNCVFHTITLV